MSGRFFHSSELGAVIVVVVAVVDKAVVARELFDPAVRRGEEQHNEHNEDPCIAVVLIRCDEIVRAVQQHRHEHGKAAAAARTSETSGNSGKKAAEGVAKKPSAKQVREAVEKLDSEIREINREYFQATYEAQYSDNAAERESEVSAAGKNREKKLVKAYEKFNSAAVPERKECNVGKIVKELRKERVAVENMKAEEWHSLMKGKAVQPPLVSGTSGAAGKGSALMLARTPAGYALKAAGAINQASRQANAEM